jgi:hypothetical protein
VSSLSPRGAHLFSISVPDMIEPHSMSFTNTVPARIRTRQRPKYHPMKLCRSAYLSPPRHLVRTLRAYLSLLERIHEISWLPCALPMSESPPSHICARMRAHQLFAWRRSLSPPIKCYIPLHPPSNTPHVHYPRPMIPPASSLHPDPHLALESGHPDTITTTTKLCPRTDAYG